ncbi:MAG: extracellular solute-binding protein [Provencibacterium sp.]|jgi:putative aldouronate transport system substrate-binding protein|nr:extracellular solute-binding protein [Provencibacterium sp.]
MNYLGKKALCAALAASMATAMFAGCSGGSSSSSSAPAASGSSAAPAASSQPAADGESASSGEKERITLSILKGKASTEVPYEEMMVIQGMSEKFNIDFQWDQPLSDNFTERFNLIMVSNDLPDIVMDMPMNDIMKYASAGSIIPLTDYVNNQMPNLKAALDARANAQKNITYPDGNIYYFPMIDERVSGNMPYGVRTDWLEKLGLESPVTIDDWMNYWKQVKEQDVNGNGDPNDEVPFSAASIDSVRNFCSAWGVVDIAVNNGFYNNPDDGKVHFGPIDEGYRQFVEWIADMYAKGYIDPEIVTMTNDIYQSKVAQDLVGSLRGPLGGNFGSFNSTMPEKIPGFHVMGTVPPVGPDGKYIHTSIDQMPRGIAGAAITSKCENVDRAIEWIDWMYSAEGALYVGIGEEGVTYTKQGDKYVLTDDIMKDPERSPKQMVGTFTPAQSTFPFLFSQWNPLNLDDATILQIKDECIIPFLDESNKYILPGTLAFDASETEELNLIRTDVETYMKETFLQFMTGAKPLSDWDSYVDTIKGMNIDRAIEIYQKAYDAWKA